jgi:3-hydroxyisobutyrate dehydrogenase
VSISERPELRFRNSRNGSRPVEITLAIASRLFFASGSVAGLVQALSEGIHFAKRAGLDVEKVIDVISKGAAQSWQMQNRYKTMMNNEFEFGFAVDWMRKDLGIAMEEGAKNGATLPITKIVDGYYEQVQKNGGKRWDTSSLISLLEKA